MAASSFVKILCAGNRALSIEPGSSLGGTMLSPDVIAILVAAAVAGGFVVGIAGFGGAPVILSIWLLVLEPTTAAPALMLASVFYLLPALWLIRSGIRFSRLLPFLIGAAIGLPVGTQLLVALSSEQIKVGIGVLLIFYAALRLFLFSQYTLPFVGRAARLADAGLGVLAGAICGTAAVPGPVFSMWCGMRGWSKGEQRGVYQPLNFLVAGMSLVSFAGFGLMSERVVTVAAWSAPAVIAGILIGTPLYNRMSDDTFRTVILILLAIIGCFLIATN